MLIDFEKALDSVLYKFLYKVLDFFNFGEYISPWITIFNTIIAASVQQCGCLTLSDRITITRGCRQGYPIAYAFLLCAQMLERNNRECQ